VSAGADLRTEPSTATGQQHSGPAGSASHGTVTYALICDRLCVPPHPVVRRWAAAARGEVGGSGDERSGGCHALDASACSLMDADGAAAALAALELGARELSLACNPLGGAFATQFALQLRAAARRQRGGRGAGERGDGPSCLASLDLSHLCIPSDGWSVLLRAIGVACTGLREVRLGGADLSSAEAAEAVGVVAGAAAESLSLVDVSHTSLPNDAHAARLLARGLAKATHLRTLDLSFARGHAACLQALAEAIENSVTLELVDLSHVVASGPEYMGELAVTRLLESACVQRWRAQRAASSGSDSRPHLVLRGWQVTQEQMRQIEEINGALGAEPVVVVDGAA